MDQNNASTRQELNQFTVRYIEDVIAVAELFQNYEVNKATTRFVEIINDTSWLLESLVAQQIITPIDITELNGKLSEIVEALENQDYILVGDLLQYELVPKIEEYMKRS